MKRLVNCSTDDKLQEAIKLINDYLRYEFNDQYFGNYDDPDEFDDEVKPTDDLSDIGLLYTTYGGDNEVDMQVSADLINPSIKYYINDNLRDTVKYNSLDDLIANELTNLNWDDMYSHAVSCIVADDYDPEVSQDYIDMWN